MCCQLAPTEQNVILEAGLMTVSAAGHSNSAFGKESIVQLTKDIKEIKGLVIAQWEPDEATVVCAYHPRKSCQQPSPLRSTLLEFMFGG